MNPTGWADSLSFSPRGAPETDAAISALEDAIGVRLPDDYRLFLATCGGGYLSDGLAECTCPTPFGPLNITILHSVPDVARLLNSTVTPRNMICIGYGHFGMTTCLSIAGLDHGQVFGLDTEMRYYWDEETLSRLPHLDESIKDFFHRRDSDELPERPWGYENCYHVADNFADFLAK
ncbi:MAG TPA: SMI1/KNR4 family protein, partial [Planctomycetaceae bacterium]|nr:SMI1/KNR4 family protein [Planctomycetaceae bacterium]